MANMIKCQYCNFRLARFKGPGRYQGTKLFLHVLEWHEEEFFRAIGFAGTLDEYLDMREAEFDSPPVED
jgi:hypothetical protein